MWSMCLITTTTLTVLNNGFHSLLSKIDSIVYYCDLRDWPQWSHDTRPITVPCTMWSLWPTTVITIVFIGYMNEASVKMIAYTVIMINHSINRKLTLAHFLILHLALVIKLFPAFGMHLLHFRFPLSCWFRRFDTDFWFLEHNRIISGFILKRSFLWLPTFLASSIYKWRLTHRWSNPWWCLLWWNASGGVWLCDVATSGSRPFCWLETFLFVLWIDTWFYMQFYLRCLWVLWIFL